MRALSLTPALFPFILLAAGCASAPDDKPRTPAATAVGTAPASGACSALASTKDWSIAGMRILTAQDIAAGEVAEMGFGMKSPPLPAHCQVTGLLNERVGQDGQTYAIRFMMRLPTEWNHRFLFQGGGGTNGEIGTALGVTAMGQPPALVQGYAVITQDGGHSNQLNGDPAKGGMVSFGHDAEARADYGHASLKASYDAARTVIARFYGGDPAYNYFAGCSKGGQEGMAFAQRYPDAFDGVLAGAPGFSLPKAAISQAWDTQVLAKLVGAADGASVPVARLIDSFSPGDLLLAREAVLNACDADDGLADGIVGGFAKCTTSKVMTQLRARQCSGEKNAACISPGQIDALAKVYAGPHNAQGKALYASFPWDAGMADDGWRVWKIGLAAQGPRPAMPAISAAMGAGALATIFSTPPRGLAPTPQAGMDYQLAYDFDRDPPAIFATNSAFPRSAWDDISARSSDLSGFRTRGAKMIVPHGVSDPVFSINDTIAWWNEVDQRNDGQAASFVRVFPVPGMVHCGGGPAADQFDAFGALVRWVEQSQAPDSIAAAAGPTSPWPGRRRPLCPYPLVAQPTTANPDPNRAEDFACSAP